MVRRNGHQGAGECGSRAVRARGGDAATPAPAGPVTAPRPSRRHAVPAGARHFQVSQTRGAPRPSPAGCGVRAPGRSSRRRRRPPGVTRRRPPAISLGSEPSTALEGAASRVPVLPTEKLKAREGNALTQDPAEQGAPPPLPLPVHFCLAQKPSPASRRCSAARHWGQGDPEMHAEPQGPVLGGVGSPGGGGNAGQGCTWAPGRG